MTIVDILEIAGLGSGEIRRQAWDRSVWLEFHDGRMVNPEILTTDDLRAKDWCFSNLV
jgi:hypothetical protein